jgi:hypothetical protein
VSKKRKPVPSALQIYWYEMPQTAAPRARWGQFMGAIFRLVDLEDELIDASKQRDISKRLHRVIRIIESYLHRSYELRERAVNLLGAVTGEHAIMRSCKDPKKRAQSLGKLRGSYTDLVDNLDQMLGLLDNDMLLRNMHTHEQFLSIGLVAPNGPYDPDDILMQLENNPSEYRWMVSLLRSEIRKLVSEYRLRIRDLRDAALALATSADNTLKATTASNGQVGTQK